MRKLKKFYFKSFRPKDNPQKSRTGATLMIIMEYFKILNLPLKGSRCNLRKFKDCENSSENNYMGKLSTLSIRHIMKSAFYQTNASIKITESELKPPCQFLKTRKKREIPALSFSSSNHHQTAFLGSETYLEKWFNILKNGKEKMLGLIVRLQLNNHCDAAFVSATPNTARNSLSS